MARKTTAIAQLKLRIREDLRAKLERAARNGVRSLNSEIVFRLEQSLEAQARMSLSDIAQDMELTWHKFGERFLINDLQNQVVDAVLEGDLDRAQKLAELLRRMNDRANGV